MTDSDSNTAKDLSSPDDVVDKIAHIADQLVHYHCDEDKSREVRRWAKKVAKEGAVSRLEGDLEHAQACELWGETLWERAEELKEQAERPTLGGDYVYSVRGLLEDYITDDLLFLVEFYDLDLSNYFSAERLRDAAERAD